MKNVIGFIAVLFLIFLNYSCSKNFHYPGGEISPYISIYDIRDLYTGTDVKLTKDVLFGSTKITGVVVSDYSGGNMPAGLLVIQDSRRLSQLRGISVAIGDSAANYVPGDSVIVNIEGSVLKRVNGILEITGVPASNITKVSSGNSIPVNIVTSSSILANPDDYESTLLVLKKSGFDPAPTAADTLGGDKLINDGFGDITLHTETSAQFAHTSLPFLSNFYGIIFNKQVNDTLLVPQLRLRTNNDIVILSSTISVSPVIITGFISDVKGSDGNYEYMQFMATKDIDFSVTPYSVVVTNNANASTPTGYPANGWATGGMRTYKFNITSGKAAKGTFFYVGGTGKLINGSGSTNISSANWVKTLNYTTNNGDGFGTKTSGLFANSGNASGFAVFSGTNITVNSVPVDVIFVGSGGSLYTNTPSMQGYKITTTDWYDIKNAITLEDQPYYKSGSNTLCMSYTTADVGYFYKLGGVYNVSLGRWTTARSQTNVLLSKTSTLDDIEKDGATTLK